MQKKQQPVVIGVGEVLWDLLPGGKQIGGAPMNFACHAHALGAEAVVVSRVGNDDLGSEVLARMQTLGLRTDLVSIDPLAPTGTVSVTLNSHGHPSYIIHENVAWDLLEATPAIVQEASRGAAVCFGTLAQRCPVSRVAVRAFLQAAPKAAMKVFDVNLRQQFYSLETLDTSLRLANVLKINDEELVVAARLLAMTGDEKSLLDQLAARYDLRAIALTKGAAGSVLMCNGRCVSRPAGAVKVVDTVGAGDAFTAAFVLGLLSKHEPERILENAHRVAEFVCSQPGATPDLPRDLRHIFA